MAVVAVSFDGTRVTDAEALSPSSPVAGVWEDDGGGAAVLEPDVIYQNTYSISEKVKAAELGVCFIPNTTTYDYTTPKVALFKVQITSVGILNTTASAAAKAQIGSGATAGSGKPTDYYEYYIATKATYPSLGGWLIVPIDPNKSGYVDATGGSGPTLTAINYWGWVATMSAATAKSENLQMDAFDQIDAGTGLTLVGGDGTDTDGVLKDFSDTDSGNTSNRWGVIVSYYGIYFVRGVLTIGTSTATVFSDTNKTLIFPDERVDTGFCGIDIGMSNALNDVDFAACNFVGNGSYGADGGTADTRPDFTVTGTIGVGCLIDACKFQNFNSVTLTSKVTLSDTVFVECESLVVADATVSGCTFDSSPVASSTAFMTLNDPDDVSDCQFISGGTGHAIEITATGSHNFYGNIFSGYGTNGSNDAAVYNNSGGLVTLSLQSGDTTPTVKNGSGASTVFVNNVTVKVTAKDAATDVVIEDARVFLYTTGSGDLPAEDSVTLNRSGATVTVAHTAHGMSTGDKVHIKGILGTVEEEYLGVYTITVTGVDAYTYTITGTPSTPASGSPTSTYMVLHDFTSSTGILQTTTFNYTSDQPVGGYARKGTASPFYQEAPISGIIGSTGVSFNVPLVSDE